MNLVCECHSYSDFNLDRKQGQVRESLRPDPHWDLVVQVLLLVIVSNSFLHVFVLILGVNANQDHNSPLPLPKSMLRIE